MGIEVRPATGRWADFASLMVPRTPGGRGCVCIAYRKSSLDMPGRIAHMRALCASDPGPGVLAYVEGQVAGWCPVAPKTTYRALVSSRTIPHVPDEGAWSVVCFVVRPGFRRRGLMHQLLDGAVGHARAMGAAALEGYRPTLAVRALTRPAVMWAPSSCSRHTGSGVSARPPAGAAASPAGWCAASFPDPRPFPAPRRVPRTLAASLGCAESAPGYRAVPTQATVRDHRWSRLERADPPIYAADAC